MEPPTKKGPIKRPTNNDKPDPAKLVKPKQVKNIKNVIVILTDMLKNYF